MKKKSLIIAAAAATLFGVAQVLPPAAKLKVAEGVINEFYVDEVDESKLVEDAIKGMLDELDPHSSYSTAEETRELNEPLQGNFSGIGITFNMNRDTLYVIQTVPGGPSERVGILAGDRMLSVNDTTIAGVKMKNSDIMKRLRGPKGTDVEVKVLRRQSGQRPDTIDFRITRADIPIKSIDAAYMADPKTGYIRVNKFAAETAAEFAEALLRLRAEGMTQLILDLTDNGGGYLGTAVELAGELLPPDRTVVYTEGRKQPRYDYKADPAGPQPLFADGRLVVMTNQYSASAAEITSGAVQDWDRGVVVGRRTFGKGLVQRPFPFPDGSMIRLTIAHYYTPSGRDIQKPYEKGDTKAYAQDIIDRFNRGELMHADSIHHIDSLKVETLVNRRTIYGGGGISPDRFVPLDTTEYTKYYRSVMAKGLINRYSIGYVDAHRKELQAQYPTDNDYIAAFEVTPAMLDELRSLADEEKIEFNAEEFEKSTPLFAMIIKALIGRDVYHDDTYFKVYNRHDPIFNEALRVINSDDYNTLLAPRQKKK